MPKISKQKFTSIQRLKFDGGVNYTFGSRQIADNESPDAINCDFKGKSGIGNRGGFTQLGAASAYNQGKGFSEFHTSVIDQGIKFVSDGSNVILSYSTGGAWTDVTGTTFSNVNMDAIQGASKLYTGNGTDSMYEWDGSAWGATSNGTKGYYPTFYNSRIWVKDEQYPDRLNFSGQYGDTDNAEVAPGGTTPVTTNKIGDFTDASAGWIRFKAGSGAIINGIVPFKSALYVLLSDSIYRLAPTSTADTFTVELVTNSVGCVSHRTIKQVEEDIYFASDDGVYSLGDVANYTAVKTTNKSGKVQRVFDALTAAQKSKLTGCYYKFKYYLFYTLSGSNNNACLVYDIRYKAWQDWRNMDAVDSKTISLQGYKRMFFLTSDGKVQEMGLGSTDDGAKISSYWKSKSYDEGLPDVMKFYFDSSFLLGALNGSADLSVIFNDSEVKVTKTLSQARPQGGFGRDAFGVKAFGSATNSASVSQVYNFPQRLKAKGKKYAIQYKISSSDQWRLDSISQYLSAFDHFKILPQLKLN